MLIGQPFRVALKVSLNACMILVVQIHGVGWSSFQEKKFIVNFISFYILKYLILINRIIIEEGFTIKYIKKLII